MEKEKMEVYAEVICANEQGIWFVHCALCIIYFYDFEKQDITFSRIIPNDKFCVQNPYWNIMYHNNNIYLFARYASKSYRYNVVEDKFYVIQVGNAELNEIDSAYMYMNYIYIFPLNCEYVFKYNVKTEEISSVNGIQQMLKDKNLYINKTCQYKESKILVTIPNSSTLNVFDMMSEKWIVSRFKNKNANYSCIVYDDDKMIAFDKKKNSLLVMDLKENIICERNGECGQSINISILCNGWIATSNLESGKIQIWDKQLNSILEVDLDIKKTELTTNYLGSRWVNVGNKSYCITKSSELIVFDGVEQLMTFGKKLYSDNGMIYKVKYCEDKKNNGESFNENTVVALNDYIDVILYNDEN